MPCIPCRKARRKLEKSVRRGDVRGAAKAVELGARIALLKRLGYDEADILRRVGRALGMTEKEIAEVIDGKKEEDA